MFSQSIVPRLTSSVFFLSLPFTVDWNCIYICINQKLQPSWSFFGGQLCWREITEGQEWKQEDQLGGYCKNPESITSKNRNSCVEVIGRHMEWAASGGSELSATGGAQIENHLAKTWTRLALQPKSHFQH